MDYLDGKSIAYEKKDVRGDAAGMKELKEVSRQTRTPTLVWDGDVLADFGIEELEEFFAKQARK